MQRDISIHRESDERAKIPAEEIIRGSEQLTQILTSSVLAEKLYSCWQEVAEQIAREDIKSEELLEMFKDKRAEMRQEIEKVDDKLVVKAADMFMHWLGAQVGKKYTELEMTDAD